MIFILFSVAFASTEVFCASEYNHEMCASSENKSNTTDSCSTEYDPEDVGSILIQGIYSSLRDAECKLANPADYPAHYSTQEGEYFDFIVVGAGSAGAVIANRLSEVAEWNVLLIEAGGNPTKTTEIPGAAAALQLTKLDWQYRTDPDEDNCLGMTDKSCSWPRGKVLGGSSSINFNLYVRGNKKDYDSWAEAGNVGWDYKSVLEYFKKSENLKAEEVRTTNNYKKYHGDDGDLTVDSWENYKTQNIVESFTKGMEELGYQLNNDCNGESQIGLAKLQGTIRDGRRCSTAKAFLSPIKTRKNLKVSKNSLVTQVLIDNISKTAKGVEYLDQQGKKWTVKTRKEVIVSGGTINSPQLLMLSGIGPRSNLEALNIDVIKDLPVGENLQDHVLVVGLVFSLNYTREIKPITEYMYEFLSNNFSKLSNIGMTSYNAFINTLNRCNNFPDIQISILDFDANDTFSLSTALKAIGIRDDIAKSYYEINSNKYTLVLMPTLLKPVSRGKIILTSANPLEKPKIVAGYFSDNGTDLETLLRAIDFIEKLASSDAMKSLDTKFHEIPVPECSKYPVGTKDFRVCSMKHLATSGYHPTSTCKMGPANDPTAVVDPYLRVIGVTNLRVADASIMPTVVHGNTNAASIMIGEKASDLIKETWL